VRAHDRQFRVAGKLQNTFICDTTHTHTHTRRYALTIAFTCDDTKALTGEWDPPAAPPPPPDSLPE